MKNIFGGFFIATYRTIFFSLLIAFFAAACGGSKTLPSSNPAEVKELFILCGAANKPAMEEIASAFEKERGVKITMTFGGSGTLLSQCELSRKGDIYLPGSPDYIIIGENKKLLIPHSDTIVCYLIPAIIVPKGNPKQIHTLEDLAKPGVKVGVGNPETVCLGLYGIELLEYNHLLERVMPNIVTFGESCEKSANLAAMRQCDAILGWKVFESWNPDKMQFIQIPSERVPRLSYVPISIPVTVRDTELAKEFINYVTGPVGQQIYQKWGYIADLEVAKKFAPTASIGGEYKLPEKFFELLKKKK